MSTNSYNTTNPGTLNTLVKSESLSNVIKFKKMESIESIIIPSGSQSQQEKLSEKVIKSKINF